MNFLPLDIPGAWQLEGARVEDHRGHFVRTWCADELASRGLAGHFVQSSSSFNHRRGTLRGMHLQRYPHGEEKLVRCTAGAIFDVMVDLRPESPTYLRWLAVELSASNGAAVYLPKGVAHGFQTLTDGAEVLYCMTVPFHAPSSHGVRWNDPAFRITWPLPDPILSERDASYPDLRPE